MNLGKATVMIASTGVAMTIINQLNSMLTVTQFCKYRNEGYQKDLRWEYNRENHK